MVAGPDIDAAVYAQHAGALVQFATGLVVPARQLWLRIPRSHPWGNAFIEALTRIRALPAFA